MAILNRLKKGKLNNAILKNESVINIYEHAQRREDRPTDEDDYRFIERVVPGKVTRVIEMSTNYNNIISYLVYLGEVTHKEKEW